MSLEIIVQEIQVFGSINKVRKHLSTEDIHQSRCFRATLGATTYTSINPTVPTSSNQLLFTQQFSILHDSKSFTLYIEIFSPYHSQFNNSDLEQTLFAEFNLTDFSTIIDDRIQTTLFDVNDKVSGQLILQAVGNLSMFIEVFRQAHRFTQKVTPKVLFQACKQQQNRQLQLLTKASPSSMNIKELMVTNSLSYDSIMTINYLQVKPDKQDTDLYNKQAFIYVRYGITNKQYTKLTKVQHQSKDSISFVEEYMEFMMRKDGDNKFEFFFLVIDEVGEFICKAKGEIKYIMFDQTINNHSILIFDKRSGVYGDLIVKFIQKDIQQVLVTINNNNPLKGDKRIRGQQERIQQAITQFNRYKFQSKNNNRILSQKLMELERRKIQQQQQKSKPITDPIEIKKRQQHSRFIQFLQKQVIKIDRQLKQKQIQQKKQQRKEKYQSNLLRQLYIVKDQQQQQK